jgi:hypothetical protein
MDDDARRKRKPIVKLRDQGHAMLAGAGPRGCREPER